MKPELPKEAKCTGCGGCANICPKDAISMVHSKGGFLVPRIDSEKCVECGMCSKLCPSLNPVMENELYPQFYAYCADDEIRKNSSSGGMFYSLADEVIKEGGYVCAALFDENMKLYHKVTNDMTDIRKMQGSKYLQSNIKNCYREIKEKLENKVEVLFVGTPCQVAALNKYINSNREYLLCIDLLCHGTPSQLFFDSYIKELSADKTMVDYHFRDKRFGWTAKKTIGFFSDGSEIVRNQDDPYLCAFFGNLAFRRSCYDCPFAKYPRQGDITIGDLWHSDKLDPKSNDKKGTSFVFINSYKGAFHFNKLKAKAKYINEIKIEENYYDKIPNRVTPKAKIHPSRARFLDLVKRMSFSKAVDYAMNDHYDIILPSVLLTGNIGSVLTYYALYNYLYDLGYEIRTVESLNDKKVKDLSSDFVKKFMPSYAYPIRYDSIMDMRELNEKGDIFVVGSDQVFMQGMNDRRGDIFFLEYAMTNKKKLAIASSFGGPGVRGTKEYYDQLTYFLNRFDYITCREDDGVKLANQQLKLNKKVAWALDPVFLCNKKHFDKIVNSVKSDGKRYVGMYVLNPRDRMKSLLLKILEHFSDCCVKCITEDLDKTALEVENCEYTNPFPIDKSLEIIAHSQFMVTDSFHGVCFSIIYKKDFLVIPRDFPDRFRSLLPRLGLENRIIKNDLTNFSEQLLTPIDWDGVYNKLNELVSENNRNVINALEKNETMNMSDFDVVMKHIERHERILDSLMELIKDKKQ